MASARGGAALTLPLISFVRTTEGVLSRAHGGGRRRCWGPSGPDIPLTDCSVILFRSDERRKELWANLIAVPNCNSFVLGRQPYILIHQWECWTLESGDVWWLRQVLDADISSPGRHGHNQ